jgi:hypothetical protein
MLALLLGFGVRRGELVALQLNAPPATLTPCY